MALPATDTFTRADGALGSNWTNAIAGYAVASNVARCTTLNTDVCSFWNADAFADDQYSKAVIDAGIISGTNYVAVGARLQGSGATLRGYQVVTDGSSGASHTEIHRWDNGVVTFLASVATTFATGDTIEIRVSGSATVTIALYKNGVLAGSTTDSGGSRVSSGGAAGIGGYVSAANVSLDNWEGGNLSSSSTTITPGVGAATLQGRAPTTSAFNFVRIREVLVNASGQPVGNATDIGLRVWYSGVCAGAPDVSLNGMTTDANGTTSWSIATGTLANQQAIFYVAQNSVSYSNYSCGRMIPSYE